MTVAAGVDIKPPSATRFVLAAVLVPVVLATTVLWLRTEYGRSEALRLESAGSYDRRIGQIALLSRLKDAETAQRGYLLTGDETFLVPYDPARRAIRVEIRRASIVGDYPHSYLAAVSRLQEARFSQLDYSIRVRRSGDMATAIRMVSAGSRLGNMDQLRQLIGRRIATETAEAERDRAAFAAYRARLQRLVYAVVGTLIGAVLAGLLFLWESRRQRHALLAGMLEAARRHATILDSTTDAILILDSAGIVESVNAAATRMLSHRAADLEHRDISVVLDLPPENGSFFDLLGLVDGRLQRSFIPDQCVRHRDGRKIPVDIAAGVMDVPSGMHLFVSLRDIADRKRLERTKDELISTVSHELRTPLTSVVGSLGLLRAGAAGEMPPAAMRLVDIAESNSRRLIRLINDMLDIDRIGSGKLVMERVPLDLRAVMEQACLGSEGLTQSRRITLACVPFAGPVTVAGDLDRLVQVVANLVSNAVRVAPAGSEVVLSIQVDDGRAILAVDDRGPGVPAAFRDRIFGRFERAAADDGTVGTGLGLAISREIVLRHDGTIWFEDRPDGGSRFAFALPLARTVARQGDDPLAVLVCEENESVATELAALVTAEGCVTHIARSITKARAALKGGGYSALIVSIGLPDEGGLAFAHSLRESDPPFDGPIIVVALNALGDGDGPSGLDVVDWVDKSGPPERLGRALRSALARSTSRQPVILHLDDDPDLLEVVAAAIEPEARIIGATDLPTARAILQDMSPDVAILDLQLAEGSGLDLIPFLTDGNGIAIPTIIYSGQDVAPDDARTADAVLVKARGTIPDLKATIRRVIRQRVPRG